MIGGCQCTCGTHVTLDEQLLEERETWRQKYLSLQKQFSIDISQLKQNIYAECSKLMQSQFNFRQMEGNKITNSKNEEIKNLVSRIIQLESTLKVLSKQNQILTSDVKDIQSEYDLTLKSIQSIKDKHNIELRQINSNHELQLSILNKKISQSVDRALIDSLEREKEILKNKIKQFEIKYQVIIPEIQKLKLELQNKNNQYNQLQTNYNLISRDSNGKITALQKDNQDLLNSNNLLKNNVRKLKDQVDSLKKDLENNKKVKRQVKVEPVYVDRPIEVQKIVEKIIEVEKVVRQYIEPTNKQQIIKLQEENKKLLNQLNNVIKEIHQITDKYQKAIKEYEECIKQLQSNVGKYKKERQQLVRKITQQNNQIDLLMSHLQRRPQPKPKDVQKIVVHVKGDGTINRTVEKVNEPPKIQKPNKNKK